MGIGGLCEQEDVRVEERGGPKCTIYVYKQKYVLIADLLEMATQKAYSGCFLVGFFYILIEKAIIY